MAECFYAYKFNWKWKIVHAIEYMHKYLTKQFMGCFGTTKHMQKFHIIYNFDGKHINIKLNNDGYVRFLFSGEIKRDIEMLIRDASDMLLRELDDRLKGILDKLTVMALIKRQLQMKLSQIFENSAEIIYIPAGRSLLATMSEQLHGFSISDMDLTMQEFINLIRATKSKFGSKIPEITQNYTKTVTGQINNAAIDQAYHLIKRILKADYTSENDGEKIYFDETHWVKLMYGSSGRQEALWILMLTFITILENRKSFVVIEEPEAHLFPIAQKDIVSLISLLVNSTASKVMVTTHSPYILTSLNILLYSDKVEISARGQGKNVIAKSLRITYKNFDAFIVDNEMKNSIESLMDKNSHMISTDYIDKVSEITNGELEQLLNLGVGNGL